MDESGTGNGDAEGDEATSDDAANGNDESGGDDDKDDARFAKFPTARASVKDGVSCIARVATLLESGDENAACAAGGIGAADDRSVGFDEAAMVADCNGKGIAVGVAIGVRVVAVVGIVGD